MRSILVWLALFAAGCAASAPAQPRAPAGDLDWISGYWLSCEGGRRTAEQWMGAGGDTLVGVNLSPDGFEFLRIAANGQGGRSYYSMPGGAPVTEFTLTENEGRRVVFSNPAHDFPQRIIYERTGDTLHARIEGTLHGEAQGMDWRFRRAAPDSRCPR